MIHIHQPDDLFYFPEREPQVVRAADLPHAVTFSVAQNTYAIGYEEKSAGVSVWRAGPDTAIPEPIRRAFGGA